ncbi:MAG TPA: hypothetical protein VMV94_00790 [Phycisphaerae bacterium]|nr:hypothetical protein [Phycisphaerae bacterium]
MPDTTTPAPTDARPANENPGRPAGRTAIYDKLSPDLRRAIDRAVVDRDPPTFRGVYERFRLADHGVSFHSLYRYARRLRAQAHRLRLADLVVPDDAALGDTMPRLIAQQLLTTLIYEETATPSEIHRLTCAYRTATQTPVPRRRAAPPV